MLFSKPLLFNQTLKTIIPHHTNHILFLFDFDGTLSPIVSNRNEAKMNDSTYSLFQKLAKISKTGILTGRSIADVQKRIPKNIPYLIGEHGIESNLTDLGKHDFNLLEKEISDLYLNMMRILKPVKGIEIEKKKYSLTIHYRNCPLQNVLLDDLFYDPSFLSSFEVKDGNKVLNIFCKNTPHKGTAVLALFREFHFDYIFYIGDDLTDEDVFQIEEKKLLTIKIGNPIDTKAKYYIPEQNEIDNYLKDIINIVTIKL